MEENAPDFHEDVMRKLGKRLFVAVGHLRRAVRDGRTSDSHGTLLVASRLEHIAYGIAVKSKGENSSPSPVQLPFEAPMT